MRFLNYELTDRQLKWMLVLPVVIFLFAMVIYPLARTLYLSFTDYSLISGEAPNFIGVRNYAEIMGTPATWHRFAVTIQFTVLTVAIETLVGFGIAMLFNHQLYGRKIALTLILTPMMLCRAVIFTFWRYMYQPIWGIVNHIGGFFGMGEVAWLSHPGTALTAIMITEIWMWTPFMILICLAGLSSVPRRLYEAAEVDRASGWFKFLHITLPIAMPIIMIGILFRVIDALKVFGQVWGLTEGGPGSSTATATLLIYRKAFEQFNLGKATALAYVLLIISIAVSNVIIARINKMRA